MRKTTVVFQPTLRARGGEEVSEDEEGSSGGGGSERTCGS